MALPAPFPWFGGKSRVADIVWRAFGDVDNYVEPFFGSGAVLLGRPEVRGLETINDIDGLVSNFWRSIKFSSDDTAEWADWPVNENDLHARHSWLLTQLTDLPSRLEGDPNWHDPKIAGWWVWGIACWIGGEFCSGKGPWQVIDGQLVHLGDAGQGVNRKLVHLGNAGQGVNRRRAHLGNAGQGVNRQLVHLGDAGRGVNRRRAHLENYFGDLADRLVRVRICCGDWSRICGPTPTYKHGLTAVFLDPPYSDDARRAAIYRYDSLAISPQVRAWAIDAGMRDDMRIALCGYEGEFEMPTTWTKLSWKAHGGYGAGKGSVGDINKHRERIWFSPACLPVDQQLSLFDI